jgi:predicted esterase
MIARLPLLIAFGFSLLATIKSSSQQTAEKYIQETRYLLALPAGYEKDTAQRWPLVLFLHGSGESGTDIEKVKVHGLPKLVGQGKAFPFILVSPQADQGWNSRELMRLLVHLKKVYRVDHDRVYLTGLSMGGYGTWDLAMAHPDQFAAIVPICGGGDATKAWKLRNMPIWNFHGAKDNIVLPSESIKMVNAIKKDNPSIRFTLYPEADHNSWDAAYGNDSLYQWMLSKTRFRYTERPIDSSLLHRYVGKYVSERKDTVSLFVDKGKQLTYSRRKGEMIPLLPAGENLFFVENSLPVDLRFLLAKGKVSGFVVRADEQYHYRKL